MKKLYLILSLIFYVSAQTLAQMDMQGAEQTYAVKAGHTRPLRDILPKTPTDALKLRDWKKTKPHYVRNFIGRRQTPVTRPGTLPAGADPLWKNSITRDGGIGVTPLVNVEGLDIDQAGAGVPDVNGDVSDQFYIETVNSTWLQVYDLAGNEVGDPFTANTIWLEIGFTSAGDPILLFDQQAGRWFMTEFPSSNRVLVAVSDSGDPFGSWTAYAFSTPSFPDYPKWGIFPEAYILTTNEGGPIQVYAMNREAILNGESTVPVQNFDIPQFPAPSWQTLQPVDWNGDLEVAEDVHPMVMRINDDSYGVTTVDRVEIYEFLIDWANSANSLVIETDIPVSPYDSEFCSVPGFGFSCVPQPNGVGIDGIPYIFMNACHYRNFGTHSSIVGNFTVDVSGDDDGGVRWLELRKTGDEDWALYQEGTVGSEDGLNRFMGGIAIDSRGNIGLAYSVSSEEYFPSLRFTGRRASDPLGKMTVQEYEFAKGGGSVGGDRFGDYASMSVDRQDMFWYAGEYVRSNGEWSTKIVGFKLLRDSIDIGPGILSSPVSSPDLASELITACVVNYGETPVTTFTIGMITPDGSVVTNEVTIDSLYTDSTYCHQFDVPVTFTDFGSYEILVFTSMLQDTTVINDTCRFTVVKQTRWDATIPGVEGLSQAICDTFIDFAFVIGNAGAETLVSADIVWSVDGGAETVIPWTGSLEMDETEEVPVHIAGLRDAENAIRVYTRAPNGNTDQFVLNDTLNFTVFITPGGQHTTLILTTDDFPQETSWQVLDEDNNLVLQGGPYDLGQADFTEEWCLDTSRCYRFVLLDAFGDGIESQGVAGHFQILNGDGVIVASLNNPNFGFSDTTNFCLQSNCALTANVFIRHENRPDGNNGSVSAFASGGTSPLQFSINGGNSFQSNPFFNNLTPGQYLLVVRDATGCLFTRDITILACDIQVMATVTMATGAQNADGAIVVETSGGNGPLEYSLDGDNFQSSPEFIGLLPDTFTVVIRDSVDCEVEIEVIVEYSSATDVVTKGYLIRVYPNPSDGYFRFELEGFPTTLQMVVDVLNDQGQLVRSVYVSNYDGILKGSFSLYDKPAGEYFVRFRHPQVERMLPLMKID